MLHVLKRNVLQTNVNGCKDQIIRQHCCDQHELGLGWRKMEGSFSKDDLERYEGQRTLRCLLDRSAASETPSYLSNSGIHRGNNQLNALKEKPFKTECHYPHLYIDRVFSLSMTCPIARHGH